MANKLTSPIHYLERREDHLRALARYQNHENYLKQLLGAEDTAADLEMRMLEARTKGKHTEAISTLHTLGLALDKASDALDLATELQRRKVAEQQRQFDLDLKNLEC
jgi:hypothetical protein